MNRMEVSLQTMIDAFNICLREWKVKTLLSVEKQSFDQSITLSKRSTSIRREIGKIVLNDDIRVSFKQNERWIDAFGAVAVEFHAAWKGIENEDYTGSYADMMNGVHAEIGDESKIARIIDYQGNNILTITFEGSTNLTSVTNIIMDKMHLIPAEHGISVNTAALVSIINDLKSVVASVTGKAKQRVTEIIARIERLIGK
jgi:hypothetical protein